MICHIFFFFCWKKKVSSNVIHFSSRMSIKVFSCRLILAILTIAASECDWNETSPRNHFLLNQKINQRKKSDISGTINAAILAGWTQLFDGVNGCWCGFGYRCSGFANSVDRCCYYHDKCCDSVKYSDDQCDTAFCRFLRKYCMWKKLGDAGYYRGY